MSIDKDNNLFIKLSSKNLTDEEIIGTINEVFKKRWKTSYEYTKETAIYFKSVDISQLKLNVEERRHLYQIALYCFELFKEALGYPQSNNLDKRIADESQHFAEGLCIYISVLAHCLLSTKIPAKPVFFTQGFMRYPNSGLLRFLQIPTSIGLHAWLNINGAVIDFTIGQEKSSFDFRGNMPIILGNIPEGLELIGFNDNAVVTQYAIDIAKQSGLTSDDWVAMHDKEMFRIWNLMKDKFPM